MPLYVRAPALQHESPAALPNERWKFARGRRSDEQGMKLN